MMVAAFWIAVGLIVYTYLLYPLVLVVWTGIKRGMHAESKVVGVGGGYTPRVSLVVAAYNEQETIVEKLENLRCISYPDGLLNVVFGSDGSTDRTAEIIRACGLPFVRVAEFRNRRGKASVLNDLIPRAEGDIVVLSDANTLYAPDTLQKLVRHFADPRVGGVCGELVLVTDPRSSADVGEGSYWKIENTIKKMESEISSTIGATGGVYAIRRELFLPLPEHKPVTDDFITALNVVRQGWSVRYDPSAIAKEKATGSVAQEFRRKARIGAANFSGIAEIAPLLMPRRGFVAFALWSRKIIRWCVPFFLIAIFVSSLLLLGESPLFRAVVAAEAVGLCLAAVGFLCERFSIKIGFLGIPFYFLAMNGALLVGFFRFLFHRERPTWEVVR